MLNIAVRAARAAANDLLQSMDRIDRLEVRRKGLNDWVTSADQRAEASIVEIIQEAYPEHAILCEEETVIAHDAEVKWIVDPLDGTLNFIHGVPHFAISIAVEVKGVIEHGVVYDPVNDELFTASKGKGALLNQRRMRVSKEKRLSYALLSCAHPQRNARYLDKHLQVINALYPKISGLRRQGSAALDCAYVASGRLEGAWLSGMRPWDLAAGTLLVQEAGGVVLDFSGGKDFLSTGHAVMGNPTIVTALAHLMQQEVSGTK